MKKLLQYPKALSFVLGLISVGGFAPYFCPLATVIALSCWLYLLLRASSAKQLFGIGYAFGFAHFALGFSWISNALLIDAATFGWWVAPTLLAAGAFFGLFFALPAIALSLGQHAWQKWLLLSATIVLGEWLRSFILTGFPWNLWGYSLAFNSAMIQLASVGGSFLLSLVMLLGGSVFGLWLNSPSKKSAFFVGLVFVLIFGGLYLFGYWRLNHTTISLDTTIVRIVQPSVPQQMKWDKSALEKNFEAYVNLSQTGDKTPDLIVWGETASPFMLDIDDYHREKAIAILPEGSYLATGMIGYFIADDDFLPHNSLVIFNQKGDIEDYYHKSHLVPFGEYIPLRRYLPKFIQPVANAIGTFGAGSGAKTLHVGNLPSFGGQICYEAIFPRESVNRHDRPDFILNLTNDGWYGDSSGPYQHWTAARLRAVEEGIQIVRAANTGISGLINALGEESSLLPLGKVGSLDVTLAKPLPNETLYSRYGNRVFLTFCLLLIFFGIINRNGQ